MAEGYAQDRWRTNRMTRWSTMLGQLFAFVVVMTIVVGGFYLILHDKSLAGITALVSAVAGVVIAFIYGRRSGQNKDPASP